MDNRPYNKLRSFWDKLIGDPVTFSLENRVFNAVSILAFGGLIGSSLLNIFLGLYVMSVFTAAIAVAQCFIYYLSRTTKKFQVYIPVYAVVSYVLLITNYYYNSGINGPTIYWFFLSFILLIAISPVRYYWFWAALHVFLVWGMLTIEYHFPDLVTYTYVSKQDRFVDIILSYIVCLIFIYYITDFIRKNYRIQKEIAEDRIKAYEEQSRQVMAQNEQLEQLDNEKNRLFSVISHDLRSPLDSIQSYLELLSVNKLEHKDRENIQNELLLLTRNTSEMMANLLSWSKSQMEGVNADLKAINLFNTLEKTIFIHKGLAEKKKVKVVTKIDSSIIIIADPDMLQLVVRNLLNNAIKFTEGDGSIVISATLSSATNSCTICIEDSGKGIDHERQSTLFSFKARSTEGTLNEKGVGLGLVMCKDFIAMQEGEIWFESKPGEGSSFYISLPAIITSRQAVLIENMNI